MSPIPVPADQIAARVPLFEQRVGHYFQNWDQLLEQWHVKVKGTIDEMETISFPKLPDVVPMEDILSGKGKDGSEMLLESYDRLIQLAYQNWQYHFEFLNLGYIAYLDFFNFCKQVFPNIPDQSIATMVQGVDMELFRPDDELKHLAKLAVELRLQPHFGNTDDVGATLDALAEAPGGDRWMAQYEAAKDPWFNFTVGNGFYGHDKYWNEHQEIPLGYIADYIRRVDEGQEIMRPVGGPDRREATASSRNTGTCWKAKTRRCSMPSAGSPPPPTRTWRTTTSTSSTGPWASSGARSVNSAA